MSAMYGSCSLALAVFNLVLYSCAQIMLTYDRYGPVRPVLEEVEVVRMVVY